MLAGRSLCGGPYHALEYALYAAAYLVAGYPVVLGALRGLVRGKLLDENFLMTIATLGAFAIHELAEAVTVMLFYLVGETLQEAAIGRARRSVRALLALRPDSVLIDEGDATRRVAPEAARVGQHFLVAPGERVPLDGVIDRGDSTLDTSALTGESAPVDVGPGDRVHAGTINRTGLLRVRVTALLEDSSMSRILDLVEAASARKARTERFITRFARVYTPLVVAAAAGVAFLPPLFLPGADRAEWFHRGLVTLVVCCPCALVISIPLGYFGGIGSASRRGILVKGSHYLDSLSNVHTVVFDKTGTLTDGRLAVSGLHPRAGLEGGALLGMAAEAESRSSHPIAQSLREAHDLEPGAVEVAEYHERPGRGVFARVRGREMVVGSHRLLHDENIAHETCDTPPSALHVVCDGVWQGYITMADKLRPDSRGAVQGLRDLGVKQVGMLTGDHPEAANKIAEELGLDFHRAGLLPEDKLAALEEVMRKAPGEAAVAFVGDGINDAPVLARADVGLAMGGLGADAAVEAADVVLMGDAPSRVSTAIEIAKRTRAIVWQNIVLALGVKGVLIVLGIAGIATMWEAVFGDVGVALLAVANASRALRVKGPA